MRPGDFDYPLPEERIAQRPLENRDASRMLVLERDAGVVRHRMTRDLPLELSRGDLLVLNDTRVRPCRLVGRRVTGGLVRALVLDRGPSDGEWVALLEGSARLREGETIRFEGGAVEAVVGPALAEGAGHRILTLGARFEDRMEAFGRAPLPPYIHREEVDPLRQLDRERYQTVYAARDGAVAAPTAGLHFTPELLLAIGRRGVEIARVTLHVGVGTFAPIRTDRVEDHRMHSEHAEVAAEAVTAVARTRSRGGRVVAVGTTTCRALESAALRCPPSSGDPATVAAPLAPFVGETDLFILPGFRFRVVDALLTNFHQPRSTLFCLVCAFAGRERIVAAYREALEQEYRFLSYGDAILIQ